MLFLNFILFSVAFCEISYEWNSKNCPTHVLWSASKIMDLGWILYFVYPPGLSQGLMACEG